MSSTSSSWREKLIKEKVNPFLLTTRIGIDFGEYRGGIAIEQGRRTNDDKVLNEIRHAEVFCDFHDTTLEQRRKMRRGRRTRHSKKMRLARLRSWVLRQENPTKTDKIADWKREHPNSKHLPKDLRLPDPYKLMRNPKFQCQPGEHNIGEKQLLLKTGKQKIDNQPNTLLTWIEVIKNGERKDSEAFVIALTHIFQKRGYSYSDAELAELTDEQLEDFLSSVALKNSPKEFKEKIESQIKRREEVIEDDDKDWRGKTKIKPEKLRVSYRHACERIPQRRKAVHRREKVQLLRDIIESFIKNIPSLSEDSKQNLINKWQNELAGDLNQDFDPIKHPKGLLNKVLREPRFDNRMSSGCAWCGKTCARKSKNRKEAYLAAVNNLRICEIPPRRIPLNESIKNQLLSLWQQGKNNHLETKQRFIGYSKRFCISSYDQNQFKKLFNQWELNREKAEKKIKNLTITVSGQKPRKLKPEEKRQFENLWTGELKEDISQDQVFWKSLNQKVRSVFSKLKKEKHPIFKEEMEKQLTDLLTVLPKGRHRLCPECLKKAAKGETRFDQDIDPWTIKLRGAPNPRREQHQKRILKRLEYLIFNAKQPDGTKLIPAPKQIKYITLEIPKPENKNASKKGQQTKTERRSPKLLLHEESIEKCIYCDRDIPLNEVEIDHIFPESNGGPDIREVNLVCSCHECNHPNTGKGQSIPFIWGKVKPDWDTFKSRIQNNLRISPRKKDILLLGSHQGNIGSLESFKSLGIPESELTDKQKTEFSLLANWQVGDPFPSDPTALARAGSMPLQFIQGIYKMFEKHGFKEDEMPVVTPVGDRLLIQRAEGWVTSRLRSSWRYKDVEAKLENFPPKYSEETLEHHAQDAALLAALPPHQWRDQIFVDTEKRPKRDEKGNPVINGNGEAIKDEFTVALKKMAPDWNSFEKNRINPLIYILDPTKLTWHKAWRKQFLKQTFWTLKGEKKDNESPVFLNGEIYQYKTYWDNFTKCQNPQCNGEKFKDIKRNNTLIGKQCVDCKRKYFPSDIQGRRRQIKKSQPQGALLRIFSKDGPVSKDGSKYGQVINAESPAESMCLVKCGKKYEIKFRLQPAIAKLVKSQFNPPLKENETIICEIRRNQIIELNSKDKPIPLWDKETKLPICYPSVLWQFITLPSNPEDHLNMAIFTFPKGYYRVKELHLNNRQVEVWYEKIAEGVKYTDRCCPALGKRRLSDEEIKEFKEKQLAVFSTDEKYKFPERTLGIEALKDIYIKP